MFKNALLILDESPSSLAAREQAFGYARRFGTGLGALAVFHPEGLASGYAVGIGGAGYMHHLEETLEKQQAELLNDLEHRHQKACEEQGVACTLIQRNGPPIEVVFRECLRFDLVIAGKDANFIYSPGNNGNSEVIADILRTVPRPVLLCPDKPASSGGPILLGLAETKGSYRALQAVAHMGLAQERPVHVLSVGRDEGHRRDLVDEACAYLKLYNVEAHPHVIVSNTEPAEIILAQRDAMDASLMAMGAFSHSNLHEMFLGSTSKRVIRNAKVPLLLCH